MYKLSGSALLSDLKAAYYEASRHKNGRSYLERFKSDLDRNIESLCEELMSREYQPRPSSCFIISDPKTREVFAADFRDRIVHHLYYDYVHELFERTFIQDSYSCIKGRGVHYGISRLERHIREESLNYTVPCYVLKMDIRGYFMHINRVKLLEISRNTLSSMENHKLSRHRKDVWSDVLDFEFIDYLTREIALLDPLTRCRKIGDESDWDNLPYDKSLFHSPSGCGLPIGNLTSQLFSNVYLNELDQFMKRTLHCRHYGRYVDDFYVVSADRKWLDDITPEVRAFLRDRLDLTLHEGKLSISSVWHGVEFLGAYLKPRRIYLSKKGVSRIAGKLEELSENPAPSTVASLNSYCGVMSHGRNYRLRRRILGGVNFSSIGSFDSDYLKFSAWNTRQK